MEQKLYISKNFASLEKNDLHKMVFIFNALHDGWEIKIHNNKYYFKKKHEFKQEIYSENYLSEFIKKNIDI